MVAGARHVGAIGQKQHVIEKPAAEGQPDATVNTFDSHRIGVDLVAAPEFPLVEPHGVGEPYFTGEKVARVLYALSFDVLQELCGECILEIREAFSQIQFHRFNASSIACTDLWNSSNKNDLI